MISQLRFFFLDVGWMSLNMCLLRFANELKVLEHSLHRNCLDTFTFSLLTNVPNPTLDFTCFTFSCTVFTWRSRSSLVEKLASQSLQLSCEFSFWWILTCLSKLSLRGKVFPHSWHFFGLLFPFGFSLWTFLVCFFRLVGSVVSYGQISHFQGAFGFATALVCFLMWLL